MTTVVMMMSAMTTPRVRFASACAGARPPPPTTTRAAAMLLRLQRSSQEGGRVVYPPVRAASRSAVTASAFPCSHHQHCQGFEKTMTPSSHRNSHSFWVMRSLMTMATTATAARTTTTRGFSSSTTTLTSPTRTTTTPSSTAAAALVAGGASGLGLAATKALLMRGARVVVADLKNVDEGITMLHNDPDLVSFVDNKSLQYCQADVTHPEQVSAALDTVELEFGRSVNVAVCCAGIASARRVLGGKSLKLHTLEEFANVLSVNTIGSFNVARLASERMVHSSPGATVDDDSTLREENGCIILTSSIAAYDGQIGQVAYAASKAAVAGMTLPLARDLAVHKIRVVTIAPGLFHTPLLDGLPDAVKTELGKSPPFPQRLGRPSEFGQLVVSIVDNPYLNGEVIRLDGALRMPP